MVFTLFVTGFFCTNNRMQSRNQCSHDKKRMGAYCKLFLCCWLLGRYIKSSIYQKKIPASSSSCSRLQALRNTSLTRKVLSRFSSSILRISTPEGLKISRRASASAATNGVFSPIFRLTNNVEEEGQGGGGGGQ